MKKYIVIALIVIVGGALLIGPLMKEDEIVNTSDPVTKTPPVLFTFKDNLATIGEELVDLEIEVNEELAKLELIYNDSVIMQWENVGENITYSFAAGMYGVGTRKLDLLATLKDGSEFVDNRFTRVLSDIVPEQLTARIVGEHPHKVESFTQGLEFYEGRLFEGTGDPGNQGNTLVAEVDLASGEHKAKMGLPAGFFGEGITILNGTLYQLTWQNQKCYAYDVETLQVSGEFSYVGEGWGLCNDGSSLIMSDGSERIVFRNAEDFTIERTIDVYNNQGPIANLNELEYIDGKIYANVWTTNAVVVIDPLTGKVLQQIDGTELIKAGRGVNGEVMNGIARNQQTGKIYMTGKNWNKLFEVQFVDAGM